MNFGEGADVKTFEHIMATIHNHFLNMSIKHTHRVRSPGTGTGTGEGEGEGKGKNDQMYNAINNIRFFIASNNQDVKTQLLR